MWHIQFFTNDRWCNLGLPLPSYELANQILARHRSPVAMIPYRAVFVMKGR